MIEEIDSSEDENPYATSGIDSVQASVTPVQRPANISTLAVAAIVFACLLLMLVLLVMSIGFIAASWFGFVVMAAAVIGPFLGGWLMIEMLRRR